MLDRVGQALLHHSVALLGLGRKADPGGGVNRTDAAGRGLVDQDAQLPEGAALALPAGVE